MSNLISPGHFLLEKGFWKTQRAEKYIDKITNIMRDPFYAGFLEYKPWEVVNQKGNHKNIISIETHELILKRLDKGDFNKRVRIDTSPDFPMRGLIVHDECNGGHITGAWYPNGKGSKYRKYVCHTPGCPSYNKPFRADDVETKFEEVLKRGGLKKEIGGILKKKFDRVWKEEIENIQQAEQNFECQGLISLDSYYAAKTAVFCWAVFSA